MSKKDKKQQALLLSSAWEGTLESWELISTGHRYCTSMFKMETPVVCRCEIPSNDSFLSRLECRDQVLGTVRPLLAKALNAHHVTDLTDKEWLMLTGHWLTRYISAYVQRYFDLRMVTENSGWSAVVTRCSGETPTPPQTTAAATRVFNSEEWDVYAKLGILSALGHSAVRTIRVQSPCNEGVLQRGGLRLNLAKKAIQALADRITKIFSKRAKFFTMATYLPLRTEIGLHLRFRQVPQFWKVQSELHSTPVDKESRAKLASKIAGLSVEVSDSLTRLVLRELFENIPMSFVETFDRLATEAKVRGWPSKPEVVFTSNAFDGDDTFKKYAVDQMRSGARYVVGQHGNNYGTLKSMTPTVEEMTSNTFFTWGWKGDLSSHYPGFILKLAGRNLRRRKPEKFLLLQLHLDNSFNLTDAYLEHENYFSQQLSFANELNDAALRKLVIRLHPTSQSLGWGEHERWKEQLRLAPTFSESSSKVYSEFEHSSLVINSYDSTGLLECLSQNIPTVAFWSGGLDHLTETARPLYDLLSQAGIVHFSPRSLAIQINEVGDRIDEWWGSVEVQDARKKFCNEFARTTSTPIRDLENLLRGKE
jgi:putative transferase (TIGR04331 family)